MRDAATVARYAAKAQAHVDAIMAGRSLPLVVSMGDLEATVLTLGVNAIGDLVATLTWKQNGIAQTKPDGAIQTWVVNNPPLYVADPRGTEIIAGARHRRDPLAIAQAALLDLLQCWAALP